MHVYLVSALLTALVAEVKEAATKSKGGKESRKKSGKAASAWDPAVAARQLSNLLVATLASKQIYALFPMGVVDESIGTYCLKGAFELFEAQGRLPSLRSAEIQEDLADVFGLAIDRFRQLDTVSHFILSVVVNDDYSVPALTRTVGTLVGKYRSPRVVVDLLEKLGARNDEVRLDKFAQFLESLGKALPGLCLANLSAILPQLNAANYQTRNALVMLLAQLVIHAFTKDGDVKPEFLTPDDGDDGGEAADGVTDGPEPGSDADAPEGSTSEEEEEVAVMSDNDDCGLISGSDEEEEDDDEEEEDGNRAAARGRRAKAKKAAAAAKAAAKAAAAKKAAAKQLKKQQQKRKVGGKVSAAAGAGKAMRRTRDELFATLLDRALDVNAHVRAKVLSAWALLLEEQAVPSHLVGRVAAVAAARLNDKVKVRVNALRLLCTAMQTNEWGANLSTEAFKQQFGTAEAEAQAAFAAVARAKTALEVHYIAYGTPTADSFATAAAAGTPMRVAAGALASPSRPAANRRASMLGGPNADAEDPEAVLVRLQKTERAAAGALAAIEARLRSLQDGFALAQALANAAADVRGLLLARAPELAIEAVQFCLRAKQFNVRDAELGVRAMLPLVWAREDAAKAVASKVVDAYQEVYVGETPFPGPPARALKRALAVALGLCGLVRGATLADAACLEHLLGAMVLRRSLPVAVVKALWDLVMATPAAALPDSPEAAGPTVIPWQRAAALEVLSMLGRAEAPILASRVPTLQLVGLGPLARTDPALAQHACAALSHVGGFPHGAPVRDALVHALVEVIVHSYKFTVVPVVGTVIRRPTVSAAAVAADARAGAEVFDDAAVAAALRHQHARQAQWYAVAEQALIAVAELAPKPEYAFEVICKLLMAQAMGTDLDAASARAATGAHAAAINSAAASAGAVLPLLRSTPSQWRPVPADAWATSAEHDVVTAGALMTGRADGGVAVLSGPSAAELARPELAPFLVPADVVDGMTHCYVRPLGSAERLARLMFVLGHCASKVLSGLEVEEEILKKLVVIPSAKTGAAAAAALADAATGARKQRARRRSSLIAMESIAKHALSEQRSAAGAGAFAGGNSDDDDDEEGGAGAVDESVDGDEYAAPLSKQAKLAAAKKGVRKGRKPAAAEEEEEAAAADGEDEDEVQQMIATNAGKEMEVEQRRAQAEDRLVQLGAHTNALLACFGPLMRDVVWHPEAYPHDVLQASAVLALVKFMSVSRAFCVGHIRLLASLLTHAESPVVRANVVVGFGDLVQRWPNDVEPYCQHLYRRLRDTDVRVRKNALLVLSHLVLNDLHKFKGPVPHIALSLEDDDARVRELARLFFTSLVTKMHDKRALLQVAVPDIVQYVSSIEGVTDAEFKSILRTLLAFAGSGQRDMEGMMDKLLSRFALAKIDLVTLDKAALDGAAGGAEWSPLEAVEWGAGSAGVALRVDMLATTAGGTLGGDEDVLRVSVSVVSGAEAQRHYQGLLAASANRRAAAAAAARAATAAATGQRTYQPRSADLAMLAQCRNLAFCLAQLPLPASCVGRFAERYGDYQSVLGDRVVFGHFEQIMAALAKTVKGSGEGKGEAVGAAGMTPTAQLAELHDKIRQEHAKQLGEASAATAASRYGTALGFMLKDSSTTIDAALAAARHARERKDALLAPKLARGGKKAAPGAGKSKPGTSAAAGKKPAARRGRAAADSEGDEENVAPDADDSVSEDEVAPPKRAGRAAPAVTSRRARAMAEDSD
jgi:hypothetical protein